MPIDGLSELDRNPRQGMLRLGIKKKTSDGKKEYPCEVDYFILDPETPNPEDKKKIIDKFHEVFGINPKTIKVQLIDSDINDTFPQNYKRYGKNTPMKCIGDGKKALVTDTQWGRGLNPTGTDKRGYMLVECKGRDCIYATANEASQNKECKATATLSVNIPELGGLGVWQLTTGSFNSILNINSGIRELNATYGRSHDIPLMLERRPQETSHKGKKATHYTLHLNEAEGTAEAARGFQESMFKELEEENEALDSDEVKDEIDAGIVKEVEAAAKEEAEIDRQAANDKEITRIPGETGTAGEPPESTPHPVVEAVHKDAEEIQKKEIAAKADKVIEAFDGKPADNESKEFLDGLKKDAKAELGTEGGQPISSKAIDAQKILDELKTRCPDVPDNFPVFMGWCKAILEKAKMGRMYKEAFDLYSVKTPADLTKDIPKQGKMRLYLSGLLIDEDLV